MAEIARVVILHLYLSLPPSILLSVLPPPPMSSSSNSPLLFFPPSVLRHSLIPLLASSPSSPFSSSSSLSAGNICHKSWPPPTCFLTQPATLTHTRAHTHAQSKAQAASTLLLPHVVSRALTIHQAPLHVFRRARRCGKELDDSVSQLRFARVPLAHTEIIIASSETKAEVLPLITCHHSSRPLSTAQTHRRDEFLPLSSDRNVIRVQNPPGCLEAKIPTTATPFLAADYGSLQCAAQGAVKVLQVQVNLTGFAFKQ